MDAAKIRNVIADMRDKTNGLRTLVLTFHGQVSAKHSEAFHAIANAQERWADTLEGAINGKDH